MTEEIYEPQEDSYLLAGVVKKNARGKVLDMGTGSGIQAGSAADIGRVKRVFAIDINPKAIEQAKRRYPSKKIMWICGDMFATPAIAKERFDTIVFNPPYLPQEGKDRDVRLEGGRKGYELIGRFLLDASDHLTPRGEMFVLFSSLTDKDKVIELFERNLFAATEVAHEHIAFEDLYVYRLRPDATRKALLSKGISGIQYFAHGNRGNVYIGSLKTKKVAIKIKRRDSAAKDRIANEAKSLRTLNKKGIGPKLLFSGPNFVVYEFVEGEYLTNWLFGADRNAVMRVFTDVFKQCFVMDKMRLTKEEMIRPLKHVIIGKRIVLIDFERVHKTEKVHNVTQFGEFVLRVRTMLNEKGMRISGERWQAALREYKHKPSDKTFKDLMQLLK